MGVYYNGNAVDTTTKDELTNTLLTKIVKQEIDSKVFGDIFGIFTNKELPDTGAQIEEFETANLTATDFDPTGAKALAKADMKFAVLYHKINREKTYKATVSDRQLRKSMLSKEGLASAANAIVNELYNSSSIDDFDVMKQLLSDIADDQHKMVICDMNGKGKDMNALTKAIQTLATNMTLPSTQYNFAGFKREFNAKEDLVLIIDSATMAKMKVDSLANAFNKDEKSLVSNVIVVDELPQFAYDALKADKGKEIEIAEDVITKGEDEDAEDVVAVSGNITMYKANTEGESEVNGKPICFLLNKRAIKRDPVEREIDDQHNSAGRFTNYFLHATDLLSYSTLRNAVVIVD